MERIAEISKFWLVLFSFFVVASDLIEKLYTRVELKTKLKLYFHWHHVEALIQNFEYNYGVFHNFLSQQ